MNKTRKVETIMVSSRLRLAPRLRSMAVLSLLRRLLSCSSVSSGILCLPRARRHLRQGGLGLLLSELRCLLAPLALVLGSSRLDLRVLRASGGSLGLVGLAGRA